MTEGHGAIKTKKPSKWKWQEAEFAATFALPTDFQAINGKIQCYSHPPRSRLNQRHVNYKNQNFTKFLLFFYVGVYICLKYE